MNDRDHLAAAALTGLLAAPTDKDRSMDYWARLSYEAADAMLRERAAQQTSPSTEMATARLSAANTWLQDEIKRLRLTDEEREAIRWFSEYGDLQSEARRAEVLNGLLGRLG